MHHLNDHIIFKVLLNVFFLNKYWTYILIELPILIINSLKDVEFYYCDVGGRIPT